MSFILSILFWNVRGILSSLLGLSDMLDHVKCNVAIVSEHKLKPIIDSYFG